MLNVITQNAEGKQVWCKCRSVSLRGGGGGGTADIFTARVRSTKGGYVFIGVTLSVHTGGGGFTPSPSHNTSTGPMSTPRGYPSPSQVRMGYPPRTGYAWTGFCHGVVHLLRFPTSLFDCDFTGGEKLGWVKIQTLHWSPRRTNQDGPRRKDIPPNN